MKKTALFLAFALLISSFLFSCVRREKDEEITTEAETVPADVVVYPEPDGKKVVCLDAGHGFRDIGCDTDLLEGTEAEVTLDITMLVKSELEARGISVILTHDGRAFPSADEVRALADKAGIEYDEDDIVDNDIFSANERAIYTASIADREGIDLFLSLHVNSLPTHPDFSRYEMDYFRDNPYAKALDIFCEELSARLDNETKIFADVYDEAFLVTKVGTHPSLLIEMGYATNEADAKKLNSPDWRQDFAKKLADACEDWIATYEEK